MANPPTDLTVEILRDIRSELREIKEQQRTSQQQQRTLQEQQRAFQEQQQAFQEQQQAFQEQTMARFEVIETALRDLAQQLVVLGRGVKVAIEARGRVDERLDDHEQRIADLERRSG